MADPTSLGTLEVIGRVAAGGFLGGVIGFEREYDGHEAGTRTHALLALGAALLGAISVGAFDEFVARRSTTNVQVDVTRVASYVAAGIGFLGAGAILKRTDRVRGLTTAASLWVAAAAGLAAGLGFWAGAIATTAFAVVALLCDGPFRAITGRTRRERANVSVELAPGTDPVPIVEQLLEQLGRSATRLIVERSPDDGQHVISVEVDPRSQAAQRAQIASLSTRDGIVDVRYESE